MWYKKISGTYWREKKRYNFRIDEPSEIANDSLSTLFEQLQYENNVIIEIVEEIEYWKKETEAKNEI